jgi:multidrug efflux pump subunit AcrA (membrane-fusion protein)
MNSTQKKRQSKHVMIRIAICSLILVVGWVGMNGLASLKQPPAEVKAEERPIRVQAMSAQPGDYPVAITGYGEARVLTVVTIAPEVSGRVVYTHPMFKVGQIIPAGEVMFRIDPADYEAGLQEASARVAQWQNSVARLKKQFAIDSQRLKTLERNAQLAKTEFERVRQLFEVDRVGTRSGMDQAERAYNTTLDQADQIAQAVSLYPLQIKEAQSSLASAAARLSMAETDLSRCTVKAPFDARIKSVSLETGQYVSPGQGVLTLADDTVLEIQVSLDSRDARRWLQFETPANNRPPTAWFATLKPVECTIRWTEDKTGSVGPESSTGWSSSISRRGHSPWPYGLLPDAIVGRPNASTGGRYVLYGRHTRAAHARCLPAAPAGGELRKQDIPGQRREPAENSGRQRGANRGRFCFCGPGTQPG